MISKEVNVDDWIEQAENNNAEYRVRRVMKVILLAIASNDVLKDRMIIKGGVLLALGYKTARHTKDIDFSTDKVIQDEDPKEIVALIDKALKEASNRIDSEISCRIQSHKLQPPREDATFPTLRIKVGYAFQGDSQYQRFVSGRKYSSYVVIVDLSFNERTYVTNSIKFDDESEVLAYSIFDQVAEKYRAVIQQTSDQRDRIRRQDIFDLYKVIENGFLDDADDKSKLMEVMKLKFEDRDTPFHKDVINDPEIAQRCKKEYHQLEVEIDEELPDFDVVFERVKEYYRSLPWPE